MAVPVERATHGVGSDGQEREKLQPLSRLPRKSFRRRKIPKLRRKIPIRFDMSFRRQSVVFASVGQTFETGG